MNIAIILAVLAACDWLRRQVVDLRSEQRKISQELTRISQHLGMQPRQVPMIQCEKCSSFYSPELTGCAVCGRAKRKTPTMVMLDESAVDPERLTSPAPNA